MNNSIYEKIKPLSIEILDFLKRYKKTAFFGGELERRLSNFHKPSTVARQLRALAEEKKIHKSYEYIKGVSRAVVKYKSK